MGVPGLALQPGRPCGDEHPQTGVGGELGCVRLETVLGKHCRCKQHSPRALVRLLFISETETRGLTQAAMVAKAIVSALGKQRF